MWWSSAAPFVGAAYRDHIFGHFMLTVGSGFDTVSERRTVNPADTAADNHAAYSTNEYS